MHPCIRNLCVNFYYGNFTEPLARQFPDDFKTMVPEHAVAVAITCVCDLCDFYNGVHYSRYLDISLS